MNILTFDIEDWFHTHENRKQYSGHIWDKLPSKVEANTRRILDMLEKRDLKATFFILGWVAKKHPRLVRDIRSKGHEIAAHSYWHHNPRLLKKADFEKDVRLCLDVLEDVTGEKVIAYRAPGFNIGAEDRWAFEILAANGIRIDSSVKLNKKPGKIPYTIKVNDGEIIELPQITTRVGIPFSGGGFFRAIPGPLLNFLFNKDEYHLLYFHPRDFDPENPKTNLFSFYRNMMNTVNTGGCMQKLENFLDHNKTGTLYEAAGI
jgi:polysaccharide deacetylase family protein (PEP-CTERM system associated)